MEILFGLSVLGFVILHIIKEANRLVKTLKSSKKVKLLDSGLQVNLSIFPINKNEAITQQDNSSKNDSME